MRRPLTRSFSYRRPIIVFVMNSVDPQKGQQRPEAERLKGTNRDTSPGECHAITFPPPPPSPPPRMNIIRISIQFSFRTTADLLSVVSPRRNGYEKLFPCRRRPANE